MSGETSRTLRTVAGAALEEAAFLFVDADESAAGEAIEDGMSARIAIGDERKLTMIASRSLLVEAAANMLGTEPDDPEATTSAGQAIAELLNIVAGALAAKLYGTANVSKLGLPECLDDTPEPSASALATAAFGDGSGGIILLELA